MVVQGNSAAGAILKVGDTFLNQNPGSPEHLWVVVAGPTAQGEFVIFNLTSWKDGCDQSCPIHKGDHSFVAHDSFIADARGQLLSPVAWQLLQQYGCIMKDSVSPELLQRIQQGALDSDFTAQKLQSIITDHLSKFLTPLP